MRVLLLFAAFCVAVQAATDTPSGLPVADTFLVEEIAAVTCKANTYYWGTWQDKHYCVNCPSGTPKSTGCSACVPDPRHASCYTPLTCPAGKFDMQGQKCDDCPAGTYSAEKNSESSCTKCAAGSFSSAVGSSDADSCEACPVGKFGTMEGATTCQKCDTCTAGKFGTTAAPGSSSQDACICDDCTPGRFTPVAGKRQCFDCDAGSFQAKPASSSCEPCGPGSYQASNGSTACTPCADGYTTHESGATDASECVLAGPSCIVGKYANGQQCEVCPSGKYGFRQSETVGGVCAKCPIGDFQDATGQSACKPCPAGLLPAEDSKSCVPMPTFTVHFRLFDYQVDDTLTTVGWHLMTVTDIMNFGGLVLKDYTQKGGFLTLGNWASPDCCVTVKDGSRLTVGGQSFVYPLSPDGQALMCGTMNSYTNSESGTAMSLGFRNTAGNVTMPLDGASKLATAVGTNECAFRAGEQNPGLFMSTPEVKTGSFDETRCTIVGPPGRSQRFCIAEPPTPAPTMGPTNHPTHTETPTANPTKNPTTSPTALPTMYPSQLISCGAGPWSAWSDCSKTCGIGLRERQRDVPVDTRVDHQHCPTYEVQHCHESIACWNDEEFDCIVGDWEEYSQCSVTCGTGTQERHRHIKQPAQLDGMPCPPAADLVETESCVNEVCHTSIPTETPTSLPTYEPTASPTPVRPVDCLFEAGPWSECTANCDGGLRTRSIVIIAQPEHGGAACPTDLTETGTCNTRTCGEDCVWTDWTPYGPCSHSCGLSTQTRTRTIKSPSTGGMACPTTIEIEPCEYIECPTDCVLSAWSAWGECDQQCGPGTQVRQRHIVVGSEFGGARCGSQIGQQDCLKVPCPINCEVGPWGPYDECSKTCGVGTRKHSRVILVHAEHNGLGCGDLTEVDTCHLQPCAIDCSHGMWSEWGSCDASCGVGVIQRRTRNITQLALSGGASCAATAEERACDEVLCPEDCEMSEWQPWSECTATCGWGTKHRSRTVTHPNYGAGKPCRDTFEQVHCSPIDCPVDCLTSAWSHPEPCTLTCGTGGSLRYTRNLTLPKYGGAACPASEKTVPCPYVPCPKDCDVSEWSKWTECPKTCTSLDMFGYQERERTVVSIASHGGAKCPALIESRECGTSTCPIDCVVSDFQAWSGCPVSCGAGLQTRFREVVRAPEHGGRACSHFMETRPCAGLAPCAIECKVGEWTEWSTCDRSCGSGGQTRTRNIITAAKGRFAHNGELTGHCPATYQHKFCATDNCPVDCKMSSWDAWSPCTQSCGGGTKTRHRSELRPNLWGGVACPSSSETAACGAAACPIDCKVGTWENFGPCSATCGDGWRLRRRNIVQWPEQGGAACPSLDQQSRCNFGECVVRHCTVTKWSAWSACSTTCGAGSRSRTRDIIQHAASGGYECPPLTDSISCNIEHPCAQDCSVGDWSTWGTCDKNCGGGFKTRVRIVNKKSVGSGLPCPETSQLQACKPQSCPVDCKYSAWTLWTTCSQTCGTGSATRTRSIIVWASNGGETCQERIQTQACAETPCPADCLHSAWNQWSPCTSDCGGGSQSRTRTIIHESAHGGVACGATHVERTCNEEPCTDRCTVSTWGAFTECDKSCGTGSKTRLRMIVSTQGENFKCPWLSETQACNTQECPVDCTVGDWVAWSECSKSCGGGSRSRVRVVTRHPREGGAACPLLKETESCNDGEPVKDCSKIMDNASIHHAAGEAVGNWKNLKKFNAVDAAACAAACEAHSTCAGWTYKDELGNGKNFQRCWLLDSSRVGYVPKNWNAFKSGKCTTSVGANCPVDCDVTLWNPWTSCSLTCGNGTQTRERVVSRDFAYGGVPCPATREERSCNTEACPVDCVQEQWSAWTACSVTCGWGNKGRSRRTTVQPKNGGVACLDNHQTQACEDAECPADCDMGAWDTWTTCTKSCGTGYQERSRKILAAAQGAGSCASTSESRECNSESCPYDCQVTAFLTWSPCDTTCGGGTRTRRREVVSPATFGGKACPNLESIEQCEEHFCPVDCKYGTWTDWTECSVTCGAGGTQARQRHIRSQPSHGGAPCTETEQHKDCDVVVCPVHCNITAFGPFSDCDKSCGGGFKSRTRSIVSHGSAGYECPPTEDVQPCNTHGCPVDCEVTGFSAWGLCSAVCGPGTKTQTRVVLTEPANDGKICPALKHTASCDAGPCAHNVVMSEWSAWSECTESCDGGTKTRTRTVESQHAEDVVIPYTSQTKGCNVSPCPVNCTVGAWSSWGTCSQTCGFAAHNGVKTRVRHVKTASSFQGTVCPHLSESEECGFVRCPVDCTVGDWSAFSQCDKSCGGGTMRRSRVPVGLMAAHGGKPCPELTHHETCNTALCPIDCEVGEWGPFGDCTLTCGGGVRVQERIITVHPENNGKACPHTVRNKNCPSNPCPINCTVGDWGGFGDCSATCGNGRRIRTRAITSHAEHGGYTCEGTTDTQTCDSLPACPRDCVVTVFGAWSDCAQTCGTGFQYREREIITTASLGGQACPALQMARTCNSQDCPVDCVLGAWSAYTDCSRTCGSTPGHRERQRAVLTQPIAGGASCGATVDWEDCNGFSQCPEDLGCQLEGWGQWSTCDKSCVGLDGVRGTQTRSRAVTPSTDACAAFSTEERECAIPDCSIDCQPGDWSVWTTCTKSCNGGERYRFRQPLPGHEGNEYGAKCTNLTDFEVCNSFACPIDCEMSALGEWSQCTKTCGEGKRTATRKIVTKSSFGGLACGATEVTELCNAQECPVDCSVTGWSGWSTCVSTHHDNCKKAQFRRLVHPASHGGKPCPKELDRWAPCAPEQCPVPGPNACSHVKCVYYKDSDVLGLGEQHIRVYHHNNEANGDQHVCKHVVQRDADKSLVGVQRNADKTLVKPLALDTCECDCSVSITA